MSDWKAYWEERNAAAYRAMGMLESLLKCEALPGIHVEQAQRIVDAYDRADAMMKKAESELDDKQKPAEFIPKFYDTPRVIRIVDSNKEQS